MSQPVRIAIAGALGRMGAAVAAVARADERVVLVGRFDRPGMEAQDPELVSPEDALAAADVVIDFTTGAASAALAGRCAEAGGPALVIGSTGFTQDELDAIAESSRSVAVLRAGNFSLGVNMLMGLVAQAARALSARAYDIEVFEAHHKRKVDAPSGTALMLAEAAAAGRGVALQDVARYAREGITGARPTGEIGFSVVRGGGVIGEHSVIFAGEDEVLTLSHSARDRGLFARGALEAAVWLAGRSPGAYDMQDVLGLKTAD